MIVVLLLTMATGTAVYAMRATVGEQRVAGELSDAIWARSLSEGMAMAAMAFEERRTTVPGSTSSDLDARWLASGSPAPFSARYGLPAQLGTESRSLDGVFDAPRFPLANFPDGPQGFAVSRNGRAPAAGTMRTPKIGDYRSLATIWEPPLPPSTTGAPRQVRSRTVITGFGETRAPGDPSDDIATTGQRGLLTTIGMTRAYFDTFETR